jgi:spermidine/putrescine transport system ATP-binding protein
MNKGNVLQIGTPRQIYEQPESRFVADFIGETNFIKGTLEDRSDHSGLVRLTDRTRIKAQLPDHATLQTHQEVSIPIRPERVGLLPPDTQPDYPAAGELTVLQGQVIDVQYIGTDTRYTVRIPGDNEIVARMQNVDYASQPHFEQGDTVNVFWALRSTYILDH